MLRKFAYLDSPSLDQYVSALEDGLRQTRGHGGTGDTGFGGSLGIRGAELRGDKRSGTSESIESLDTSEARFDRLLPLAASIPEASGWLDLATIDDLSQAGIGALVDFECELEVPDVVNLLGQANQVAELGQLIDSLRALAPLLGEEVNDLPSSEEVGTMSQAVTTMKVKPVVVGESEESEWRVVGVLTPEHLRCEVSELEGPFRLTAKVGKVIQRGQHKLLLNLPGASLLPRDQRRAMEKKGPKDESERDMFVEGPARVLDVLAIYT